MLKKLKKRTSCSARRQHYLLKIKRNSFSASPKWIFHGHSLYFFIFVRIVVRTVGQINQETRCKYWATRSFVRSFARTAHSFACSGLLASLAPSAALTRSLACSLHSLARSIAIYSILCIFSILDHDGLSITIELRDGDSLIFIGLRELTCWETKVREWLSRGKEPLWLRLGLLAVEHCREYPSRLQDRFGIWNCSIHS